MKVFFIALTPLRDLFAKFANYPFSLRNHSPIQPCTWGMGLRTLRIMQQTSALHQPMHFTDMVFPERI